MKSSIGKTGEALAKKYLLQKGFLILATNYRNTFGKQLGEIDIVAKKDGCIVFVEVKTRKYNGAFDPFPEENITRAKMAKCARTAQIYLRHHHIEENPWRFDAISVVLYEQQKFAKVRHLENIFF